MRAESPPKTSPKSPLVEFDGIRKVYGDCVSLQSVTAVFEPGRIHAIVGENGAGKSTLMKILFGLVRPTSGQMLLNGTARRWANPSEAIEAGLGMVQQHFALVPTLTVIENIMLGQEVTGTGGALDRARAIRTMEKQLPSQSLALDWNRKVSDLSVGERQRVEILKLIFRNAKILVLDEPTAVLTPSEIDDLFSVLKTLRQNGHTVFVITHKLKEVFDHCDTWTALRAGLVCGQGVIATSTLAQVVQAMVGSEIPPLRDRQIRAPGEKRIEVIFEIDRQKLEIRSGEIVGIAGVDGSGQAELVDAILGLRPFAGTLRLLAADGEIEVRPGDTARLRNAGVALVSEDRHHQSLWLDESVGLNTVIGFESITAKSNWKSTAAKWLERFDVRYPSLSVPVSALSGGNQQKLVFARELLGRGLGRDVRVLICHQPTRGVDLAAVQQIHSEIIRLRDQGAAVLLISSELDELLALSDRIVAMAGGRLTGGFSRGSRDQSGTTEVLADGFRREDIGRAMLGSL